MTLAKTAGAGCVAGEPQRIEAMDADDSDWFGRAVDVSGDVAVVGAPGDDEEATNAGAAYVFRRVGGTWSQQQKLTAGNDAEQFDGFGTDVAVERDLIVVGAPGDDDADNDAGAAYIFEWNGSSWEGIEKLLPTDMSNAGYEFGSAVDIGIAVPKAGGPELTDVVVGAPRADTFQGVVFLFERAGALWTPLGRFSDSDDTGFQDVGEFGSSVAISGDHFLAGAPQDDQLGGNAGAAYLFGRTNVVNIWNEVTPLYPTDPNPGDSFGAAVALDEGVAVVGAPAPSPSAPAGRVFVYDAPLPEVEVKTAGNGSDEFGISLAVDAATGVLVVGAKRDDDGGLNAGAIYRFQRDDNDFWQPAGKSLAPDAGVSKQFGESAAIRDGTLIVGGSEEPAFTPGAAYLDGVGFFCDGFESGDTTSWSATEP